MLLKSVKPKKVKQSGHREVWRDRVIGSAMVKASQLLMNPDNFRLHTLLQKELVNQSLHQVGWVRRLLVNRKNNLVIDGHLRLTLSLEETKGNEIEVPVDYVELTTVEEQAILLMLDESVSQVFIDKERRDGILAVLENSKTISGDVIGHLKSVLQERDKIFYPLVEDLVAVDNNASISKQDAFYESIDQLPKTLFLKLEDKELFFTVLELVKHKYKFTTIGEGVLYLVKEFHDANCKENKAD